MFANVKKDYGDWNLFPDKILSNIEISNCKDTIDGTCPEGLKLEECIQMCAEDENCDAGYFISTGGDKTVCAPLRTSIHREINPTYRLIDPSFYPELYGADVTTFANKTVFPFPPSQINTLHFRDIMSLINIGTGKTFGDKSAVIEKNKPAGFGNSVDINLTVYPKIESMEQESTLIPVTYGSRIDIALPASALSLRSGPGEQIVWGENLYEFPSIFFRIKPTSCSGKKIGDKVDYDEPFLLTYNDIYIVFVQDDVMSLSSSWKIPKNATFKFVSRMKGYYCNDGQCSEVAVSDIDRSGGSGTFKGQLVTRKKDCWGACQYTTTAVYSTIKSYAVPAAVALILAATLVFIAMLVFRARAGR